jgi:predicted TIM-barrel fold metal-dependent hydrolase
MSEDEPSGFIDSHVHVWTDEVSKFPFAPETATQDINPAAYRPEQILSDARSCGVDRVVLVQMIYYGTDNSYMLEAIKQSPKVFRGIAVVNGNGEKPDDQMRSLSKAGVRGFRIYPEEVSQLDREGFRKMMRCGAEKRLALCFLINPESLPQLDRHCQQFPDTPVVIDHLARIGMGGPIRDIDVRALCGLAKYPQVAVKVSAFYALGHGRPPHVDLEPLIKRVYEAFGPKRLMWGSDCPFQIAHEAYDDSLSLIRDRLSFLSSEDKGWILARTAERIFFQ